MNKIAALAAILVLAVVSRGFGAEIIPPKPAGYFNDNAGVVAKERALAFNEQLAQFERDTSNQIVVAVYRKMETDSDIADYTQRIAQSWGVGQAEQRNGAVLFVFVDDRKMYVQVGYGLEGVIPDITAYDITERNIKPRFRANDYEGGLATGIDLLMKAARGEYKGTGKTVAEKAGDTAGEKPGCSVLLTILFIIFIIFLSSRRSKRRRGYRYSGMGGPFIGGWSSGGGGWSSGGGGWSSGGGGFSGFSGGGGDFGGGGAGSDW